MSGNTRPQTRMLPHRTAWRRMSSHMAAIVVVLTMAPRPILAQKIRPHPEPDLVKYLDTYVDYVGRYGEVFKLNSDWQIVPEMQGKVEVINYYPKYAHDRPAGSLKLFRPKASDFAPENFSRLGLVQLAIIPRSSDVYRSLDELKEAKIQNLQASGVRFQVLDYPSPAPLNGSWPAGTFEIYVSSPYRLSQLYTATQNYLAILTHGFDTPPATAILLHSGMLKSGLTDWLVPERPVAHDDEATTRDILTKGLSIHPLSLPRVWMSWVAISGLLCLLTGLLGAGGRWAQLRRISLSALVFSNTGAFLGGLFGILFWPFPWFTRHLPASPAVACLFTPLAAWGMGRVLGMRAHCWAWIGSILWAMTSATFLAYMGMQDWGPGSPHVPAFSAIIAFMFSGIGGVLFGALDFSFGKFSKKKTLLLLFLLMPVRQAWSRSLADGKTKESFREDAIAGLMENGVIYAFQRVEIRGILAPKGLDDDTERRFPLLFDKQIAPTHVKEGASMPVWLAGATKDIFALKSDAYNQLSSVARAAVQELRNKPVNEIVAHSWGTEIVYNAILANEILPPRRLIVCGMPDKDLEKWKALSKYTGTEVVVYTNTHDPVAGAMRIVGGSVESVGTASRAAANALVGDGKGITIPSPGNQFDQQWASACQLPRDCNPRKRRPPETRYVSFYKESTHDRFEYYQAIGANGDLPMPPPGWWDSRHASVPPGALELEAADRARARERGRLPDLPAARWDTPPPYRGSAVALMAAQDAKIDAEAARLFYAATNSKSDTAFLKGLAAIQGVSKESTRRAEAEQRAVLARTEEEKMEERKRIEKGYDDDRRAAQYIAALAGEACADPGRMNDLAAKGKVVLTNLPRSFDAISEVKTAGWGSINDCQRLLLENFDDAHSRGFHTTNQNFANWAAGYRREHPSLIEKLSGAVTDFFGSLEELLKSRGASSSREGNERNGGSGIQKTGSCDDIYINGSKQTICTYPID